MRDVVLVFDMRGWRKVLLYACVTFALFYAGQRFVLDKPGDTAVVVGILATVIITSGWIIRESQRRERGGGR